MLTTKPNTEKKYCAMIDFDRAAALVVETVRPLAVEFVSLAAALGRVLAEDVFADEDAVPYARSAMDGYAVRAANTRGGSPEQPVRLRVFGSVFTEAGESSLLSGAALSISTGAPIPHGADAVIPVEQIQRVGDEIRVVAEVGAGECVFPPAEDVRAGDLLVARGQVLRPGTLGLLAFTGKTKVPVFRRPRVGLLCTGSELVEIAAAPRHGEIRNSNAFTLAGLIAECGGEVIGNAIAPDWPDALRDWFVSARPGADLLVTTGGASVGERDLIKKVLTELGADFHFGAVALRPGKPIGFATWDGIHVCVLPGNPAAAFVGFHEFVRPALLRLAGRRQVRIPTVRAKLRAPVKSKAGRKYILFARLTLTESGFEVTPLPNQCSVLVRSAAEANALILLPEGPTQLSAGDTVDVQAIGWDGVTTGCSSFD